MAAVLAAALFAGVAWQAQSADKLDGKEAVRAFMRGKLDASRDVMEGLVLERFDLVANGADQMRLMSKKAEWNSIKTDLYVQYSQEFQSATEDLAKGAREKNLDATALAWTRVTLNCVNCHRYARDTAMTHHVNSDSETQFAAVIRQEKAR